MSSWVSFVVGFITDKIKYILGTFGTSKKSTELVNTPTSSTLVTVGNTKTNRVAIVGDSGVGKSTFLNCLRNTPYDNPVQTIGYDFWIDKSDLNPNTKILVFYWDSGIGRPMTSLDFHNGVFPYGNIRMMNIFILVYDATWKEKVSRKYIKSWLRVLTQRPSAKSIIVGLRRPDQRDKALVGCSSLGDMTTSSRVITSCVCDMVVPEDCITTINYIKILCKNECFENSWHSFPT
jgi:hypothetical protein